MQLSASYKMCEYHEWLESCCMSGFEAISGLVFENLKLY